MDNKNLVVLAAIPMTVSITENETEAQFLERWKKIDTLSDEKKEILSSEITIEKIEEMTKRFRLTYEETCNISRLVRSIVFGEINISQVDLYLKQKIQHLEQANRDDFKKSIIEVLSQKPFKSTEETRETLQLSISEAIVQYPRISEQGVTSDQLKLQYSPELVRSSIKNWIRDYHDAMGAGKHSPIDRGNFLFHSENGKRLTAFDRQKLAAILKSLDEQTMLTIDGDAQMVIFGGNADETRINRGSKADHGFRIEKREEGETGEIMQKINEGENKVSSMGMIDLRGKRDEKGDQPTQQEKKVETFFSIPQSKPPIGSESYSTEKVQDDNKKNTDTQKAEVSFGFGAELLGAEMAANEKSIEKLPHIFRGFGPNVIEETREDVAPAFVSPNNISFSSPQKLSVEIEKKETQKPLIKSFQPAMPTKPVNSFANAHEVRPQIVQPKQPNKPFQSSVASRQQQVAPAQQNNYHVTSKADFVQTKPFVAPVSNLAPAREKSQSNSLPTVQNSKPMSNNPIEQSKPIQHSIKKLQSRSPYHIGPSHVAYDNADSITDNVPKVSGNVVDLS